jgi:ABC-type multidrug transport system ATPase subunit
LKKNKVIVLTTHAMEEADILSDRIAVISDGKLKCVGTPLYLKNTFGDGYRISVVCETGQEPKIISLMTKIAPSSKLIDNSGGSMVFTVPLIHSAEIGQIFSLVEETQKSEFSSNQEDEDRPTRPIQDFSSQQKADLNELRSLIKDCGISHTTLEEVFMKMTGKKQSKYVVKELPK